MQVHYRCTRLPNVPGGAINGSARADRRGGWSTPGGDRARIPSAEPADKFNGRPLNRLNRAIATKYLPAEKKAAALALFLPLFLFLASTLAYSFTLFLSGSRFSFLFTSDRTERDYL